MGMDGAARSQNVRRPWPTWKRACVALIAMGLAVAIAVTLLYWPSSRFGEVYVSYDYRVVIEPDSSEQFAVICSLPANHIGAVYPNVLSSMVVAGDVTISEVTTPYGDGLEVVGAGSVVIEWSHNFTYRESTQSMYDHYWNLSMLSVGFLYVTPIILNASAHLEGAGTSFDLSYNYRNVYGNVGADSLVYDIIGNLTAGWNSLPVEFGAYVS